VLSDCRRRPGRCREQLSGRPILELSGKILGNLGSQAAANAVELGIRPEHLAFSDSGNGDFLGEVELIEELGSESFAYVQTEVSPDPVTIRLDPERKVRAGDRLPVVVNRNAIHAFDESGASVPINLQ